MCWPFLSLLLLMLQATAPTVRLDESPGSLRVRLEWPGLPEGRVATRRDESALARRPASAGRPDGVPLAPIQISSSVDGRELMVRFNRRLDLAAPQDLAQQSPAWIESVSVGFDTMLIRAARDVTFSVSAAGPTVTIEMSPPAVADPGLTPEQQDGEHRLELLRAQLLVAEGRQRAAETALTRFVRDHPASVPGLMALAQVEVQRARWRAAERRLRDALTLDPANVETVDLLNGIRGDQASRIRADVEIKDVDGGQREQTARVSGHARLTTSLRLGAAAERRGLTYLGARSERDRGELSLQSDFERGTMLRASGFASRYALGGGISLMHPDAIGRTLVQVEYQRAFWEFVEAIERNGIRDRVELRREQPLGPRLAVRAAVAANRYGLAGIEDVARSLAAEGGASATLWSRNPTVALDYAMDLESRRTLVPGTVPLVSREVHAVGISTNVRFSRRLASEAFAGYAWDRLGGRGPFNGARLTHGGPSRLELEIWIDRRLHAVTTTERVTRAGATLTWRVP